MKKILVPTDFSPNSKAGIRFAIKWASQEKVDLVFFHVFHVLRVTQWTDAYYNEYEKEQEKETKIKFEKFISGMYKAMQVTPGKHSFVIVQGISAEATIMDYCRANKSIDFISISTRGAGKLKKFFGTHTGNLITKSPVPVIAIPKTYKAVPVKSILYAADFKNYKEELKQVGEFASPFKAKIDVVHFAWPDEYNLDKKAIEQDFKKQYSHGVKLYFKKNDAEHTLIQNLQAQIKLRKPSIVIMFTNQERTFFQKLFLSSKAEELSFQAKVPLLVFKKK